MAVEPRTVYRIQVRELVSFAWRTGDLGSERDFVGPHRAIAGIRGHQKIQRSRPVAYRREVAVTADIEQETFVLRVQGRIDGLMAEGPELLVEEIKTVLPDWGGAANPLHWAQLKCYAFMSIRESEPAVVRLRLTYLDLETGKTTEFNVTAGPQELREFFETTTARYLEWLSDWHHWCNRRNKSIRSLEFPFPAFRAGQRQLAVAVYRALAGGRMLFAEAPTGIGKTVSVIFPALKALAEGKLERIFYLTARTTGQAAAEKCFADLRAAKLHVRTLTLTAKEKICGQPGQECDATHCPLAKGYYDRVKPAMRSALAREEITRKAIEEVASEHGVCPFELGLDTSMWVDAIIGDYNYAFDPRASLKRHFGDEPGDYAFLVDEAHNLVDRAREMFSASLGTAEVQETRRTIKTALPKCARSLNKIVTRLKALTHPGGPKPATDDSQASELQLFDQFPNQALAATPGATTSVRTRFFGSTAAGPQEFVLESLPEEILETVDAALGEVETWLARNEPAEFRQDLIDLYFRLLNFRQVAESADERFAVLVRGHRDVEVQLRCVDPSFLLGKALGMGRAAVFFSATLTPGAYYRELLGAGPDAACIRLASPFPSSNLAVLVHSGIRTEFKTRESSLPAVTQAIEALISARAGNYMVFFPSYGYLAAVQAHFEAAHPTVRLLVQRPGMSDGDRAAFLAAFDEENQETLLGFAVMGGVFGEGVDLVGDRLIGAVVVGVGLPQLCLERDVIRRYFEERDVPGFDYAYLFPGLNRVLQATGRVIRSESDRGVVLLIDARFRERRYRDYFPPWWEVDHTRSTAAIKDHIARFWARTGVPPPPPAT